ncbi:MAG: YgjP-like metallopeptidase domain-containing protein [Candidatus Taylorbacteria bacterium]
MNLIFKKSARVRRVSICIGSSEEVVVKMPLGFLEERARIFAEEKKDWIDETLEKFRKREKKYEGALKFPKSSLSDYNWHKGTAGTLVQERLEFFNRAFYDGRFAWKNVRVRNQKSRWGSCSKNGNLHFNYKIVFLPPNLADYLVVHELCHLLELNHSQKFWDLVVLACPDYKKLRKTLRLARNM